VFGKNLLQGLDRLQLRHHGAHPMPLKAPASARRIAMLTSVTVNSVRLPTP
jgi:hypothetical protein